MASARFAFKTTLQKKKLAIGSSSSLLQHLNHNNLATDGSQTLILTSSQGLMKRLMGTHANEESKASDDKHVQVKEGGTSFSRWRKHESDLTPALYEFFPSGLGDALAQAADNINRLFQNMNISPRFQLSARVKEKVDHYKIWYDVPGLTKDDVKVRVHDGILSIRGNHHKEEEEEEEEEKYYNMTSSLVLPEDAKVDEITAELKDGVLTIVVPKTERPQRVIKEIEVR